MNIYSYSERGIVNSIAYFLDTNSQNLCGFISAMGIPLEKNDYYCTIFVEQSFSDFGDSDLILIDNIIKKKNVIFIECKVKTYQRTFKINSEFNRIFKAIEEEKKVKGISSNLFVQ
jgi:hypothetical protein